MKTKFNFWKLATLFLGATCICLLVLSSFKEKSEATMSQSDKLGAAEQNPAVIPDRATVRQLYANFLHQYPQAGFVERSGYIGKSTITELYNKMKDAKDTMVYYYFGRTNDSKNLIMLFNDPRYNPLDNTLKFKTIDPYCPPSCNNAVMNDYVTGQ